MRYWQKCPICNGTGYDWGGSGLPSKTSANVCSVCLGKKIIETPDDNYIPQPYIPYVPTPNGTSSPYIPNTWSVSSGNIGVEYVVVGVDKSFDGNSWTYTYTHKLK